MNAEYVKEVIRKEIQRQISENGIHGIHVVDMNVVLDAVQKIPVEKTAVEKRGRWIKVGGYCTPGGDPVWACSECGKGMHVYGIEHGSYGADISDGQWVACPNCGAKMDGE